MRQPFSGTAERIFMKLSPNDRYRGTWSFQRRAAAWRMLMICVIYAMTGAITRARHAWRLHLQMHERAHGFNPEEPFFPRITIPKQT